MKMQGHPLLGPKEKRKGGTVFGPDGKKKKKKEQMFQKKKNCG